MIGAPQQAKAPAVDGRASTGDSCIPVCAQNCCCILHGVEAHCQACGSVQGVFLAPDGISTAMQLFSRQTTHLCTVMHKNTLYQAHLCNFFSLLGAMPQCLKAEADAIILMIRRAREDSEHSAAEAQLGTGDTIHLTSIFVLEQSRFSSLMLC